MDNSTDTTKFFDEIYPIYWQLAYDEGLKAFEAGLPRECNLTESPHAYKSSTGAIAILKVYKSAWEQGWDRFTIPAVFGQMESMLSNLPMRPFTENDF